jgi:SAM-dependent methyltransferase
MHNTSLLRMQWFVQTYLGCKSSGITVLDVGSYDVNGTYKRFFPAPAFLYTGLDIAAGPNVDVVVVNPYHWPMLADESFDAIICGQAFEHIEFFWFTLEEMVRVAKKNALFCIIAPRGFGRHRYPIDAYRFDEDGMIALARYGGLEVLHVSTNLAPPGAAKAWYSGDHGDSMLVAEKPERRSGLADPRRYTYVPADLEALRGNFVAEFPNNARKFIRKFLGRGDV